MGKRKRNYKDYTVVEGGDDMERDYRFCVKLRRDIPDEEICERLALIQEALGWGDWYGHDECLVFPQVPLQKANRMQRVAKLAYFWETKVLDWSELAPVEVMKARLQHKKDSNEAWIGTKGCTTFDDTLWFVEAAITGCTVCGKVI